jgi:hypothetical protein
MSRRHPNRDASLILSDLDVAGLLPHVRRLLAKHSVTADADLLRVLSHDPAMLSPRRALWHMLCSHALPKLPRYAYTDLARMWGGYSSGIREAIIKHCAVNNLPLPQCIQGTSRTNDAFYDAASVPSVPAEMRPGRLRMVRDDEQRKAMCQRYGACLDAFVRTHRGRSGFCAPTCVGYAPYEVRATAYLTQREAGSVPSAPTRVYGS